MSDYEIIDIVTTILSLVMTAIILNAICTGKKKQKQNRHPSLNGWRLILLVSEGRSHSKSVIPSCRYYIISSGGCQLGLSLVFYMPSVLFIPGKG